MTRPALRSIAVAAALSIASMASAQGAAAQVRTARLVAADGAQRAIAAALAEAKKQGWQVSIAVVDNSGDLVSFLRMDGAPVSSVDIAQAKARTAARMRRATRILDSTLTAGRTPILGLTGITPVEGGVPIVLDGEVIGAVGVSGATSAQDAQVARAGIAAVQP
jgi:glc operon protein GlcG